MIKLPGGYAITADGRNYSLCKMYVAGKDAEAPRNPGEEYPVAFKYYTTMTGACKAVVSLLQRECVADGMLLPYRTPHGYSRKFKPI